MLLPCSNKRLFADIQHLLPADPKEAEGEADFCNTNYGDLVKSLNPVTPAKAGVQNCLKLLDSGSGPE
jgi:hypothetical protein